MFKLVIFVHLNKFPPPPNQNQSGLVSPQYTSLPCIFPPQARWNKGLDQLVDLYFLHFNTTLREHTDSITMQIAGCCK